MPLARRLLVEKCPPLRVALARPVQARPRRTAQALIACARDYFSKALAISASAAGKRRAGAARR
jgi:hypothetical protein